MNCEPPFWKHPSILFKHFSLQYIPSCKHSAWNFLARLLLLSLFVGMVGSLLAGLSFIPVMLLFGGITAFVIIMTSTSKPDDRWDTYHKLPYIAKVEPTGYIGPSASEHFVNGGSATGGVQPMDHGAAHIQAPVMGRIEVDASPYSGAALPDRTPPTSRNPFMNILVEEMKYNPNRPAAASVLDPMVKQTMDDFFRVQWFSDPTDVFGKNQSQRQFVTQPSTTIPNDQGSFANWLYKIPGKTCKEGGRDACLAGTDGQLIPWLNQ
jgi:hypothetical protein